MRFRRGLGPPPVILAIISSCSVDLIIVIMIWFLQSEEVDVLWWKASQPIYWLHCVDKRGWQIPQKQIWRSHSYFPCSVLTQTLFILSEVQADDSNLWDACSELLSKHEHRKPLPWRAKTNIWQKRIVLPMDTDHHRQGRHNPRIPDHELLWAGNIFATYPLERRCRRYTSC